MNNEEKILSTLDTLVSKFDGLKDKFGVLENKFDGIENKVDRLDQRVGNIEGRFDGLEYTVQEIKHTIVFMEYDHGKKLDALFDGYIQLYDSSREIQKNITALCVAQEKQEFQMNWLNLNRKAK